MSLEITEDKIREIYTQSEENLKTIRKRVNKPLTLTEKILFSHLKNPDTQDLKRGESFLSLLPDRVAMQDATAQMALLQFMLAGRSTSSLPATVHCDHLILAYEGVQKDLKNSFQENKEVFYFLSSVASHYGIGFWKPGSGIIHQVLLENYCFPGGLMIGSDSHTPNAGGLGMIACGVGGADISDVMAGLKWEVRNPYIVGVCLKGKLQGWASAKDVILKLCGLMTVKGGTNKIIEYFGEGTSSISCTGKGTICNMGAELGATSSVFPFDQRMKDYLTATQRDAWAEVSKKYENLLTPDSEILENPDQYYDEVIEIDLSNLEPHLVGPYSPDAARPLSEVKEAARKEKWPLNIAAALIGSCTNSSYEDIGRATYIAEQAVKKNMKMPQMFMISPGSAQIKKTIERDGQMKILESVGGLVLANACGPCIGQWKRDDYKQGEANTIVSSFNRNFRGRNDANYETLSFIGSPEIVIALGLSGRLDFDPQKDTLKTPGGEEIKLDPPPSNTPEFPEAGFVRDTEGFQPPLGKKTQIVLKSKSERIQILTPFEKWKDEDFNRLVILFKAQGKCTTDHISPAGYWLRYRGHLENISNNLLSGARNAFTHLIGKGNNIISGEKNLKLSKIASDYKSRKQHWIIVGEENYGEGSSREHAAMSPRFLGCLAVIAKSFARIHETNLKKQGILPLHFVHPEDYEKIRETDKVDLLGHKNFSPQSSFTLRLYHQVQDQSFEDISLKHTFNKEQIRWFQMGSALNVLRSQNLKHTKI